MEKLKGRKSEMADIDWTEEEPEAPVPMQWEKRPGDDWFDYIRQLVQGCDGHVINTSRGYDARTMIQVTPAIFSPEHFPGLLVEVQQRLAPVTIRAMGTCVTRILKNGELGRVEEYNDQAAPEQKLPVMPSEDPRAEPVPPPGVQYIDEAAAHAFLRQKGVQNMPCASCRFYTTTRSILSTEAVIELAKRQGIVTDDVPIEQVRASLKFGSQFEVFVMLAPPIFCEAFTEFNTLNTCKITNKLYDNNLIQFKDGALSTAMPVAMYLVQLTDNTIIVAAVDMMRFSIDNMLGIPMPPQLLSYKEKSVQLPDLSHIGIY